MNDIELLGDEELMQVLRSLPGKMGKSIIQRAWTRSAKPVKDAMKSALPEDTGTARRSITTVRGKSYKSPTVFVGPRQGRSRKAKSNAAFLKGRGATNRQVKQAISADAWYLRFLWRGTKHISPKKGLASYEAVVNNSLPRALNLFKKELRTVIYKAAQPKKR